MGINEIIMYIMAFGAVLGGLDCALGNRFGLGEKFEAGFRMLGPVGLSMAGIICLAPVMGVGLDALVRPLWDRMGMDPGIFGSILPSDMGGFALSMDLANDPAYGRFCGIIMSSIFGCTIVFTIPVGVGFLGDSDEAFTRGILLGMTVMPVALIVGGLTAGLSMGTLLWNTLPVFLISALLALGIWKAPMRMMKGFRIFARGVRIVTILGLTMAAVNHMTGIVILPGMSPLKDAMGVVSSICIVMLGSVPMAELLQRVLKVPFRWIGEKTGIDGNGTTALLVGLVAATPSLALLPHMNQRSRVLLSAFLVAGECTFGAHFAFAQSLAPEVVPALLTAKILGGILGAAVALLCSGDLRE